MSFDFNITVHHYHHNADVGVMAEMLTLLRDLKKSQEKLHMAISQDFLDLAKKIDDATNAVAARITALSAKITNSMTDAEVASIKASLQGEVDRLTGLAQDPVNPVPVP